MKRIISCFLVFVLIFLLAGCKEDAKKTATVDLEQYANMGIMPETEYKLGDNVEEVKADITKQANSGAEAGDGTVTAESPEEENLGYNFVTGETTALIDTGNFGYYYYLNNEKNGISYIVNYGDAFGFPIGTVYTEITLALDGYSYTKEEFNDDNAFFLMGNPQGFVLNYTFKKTTVAFLFVDNSLFATAVYVTDEWK